MPRARMAEFVRFCMVGLLGLVVDSLTLELLVALGLVAPFARALSMCLALLVTYVLHSRFTYRPHARLHRVSFITFMLSNLAGATINYVLFLLVLNLALGATAQASRILALLVGTVVALGFNFWANRRFAFAPKERT